MSGSGVQAQTMDAQFKSAELTQFKVRMDGLKERLSNAPGEKEELRKACRDFEAVFIGKLWEQMRKTVPQEGYLHSKQEEMYTSMFATDFSTQLADAGGIGLADMIYEQLAQKLKQVSGETLTAGAPIKPLVENGKPEMKTLQEAFPGPSPLRGPEPMQPAEIDPENFAPEGEEEEEEDVLSMQPSVGTPEAPSALVSQVLPEQQRDPGGMTRDEVLAELDNLARELRTETLTGRNDPGSRFDSARKGAFLNGVNPQPRGREIAKI
ncbi:MAG: rod-binding protein [Proteobacteria bacterium]|nr:rod-binding protein [Pseudomonadota bacterium]MBU1610571.1 rod-binding protein [Pseudomonadota bacterium]